MNGRIKELMEQTGLPLSMPFDKWCEKFAELIVQECISINRQRMFSEYEGDSHRVAHNNALLCADSDMFEHFGVGECGLTQQHEPTLQEQLATAQADGDKADAAREKAYADWRKADAEIKRIKKLMEQQNG